MKCCFFAITYMSISTYNMCIYIYLYIFIHGYVNIFKTKMESSICFFTCEHLIRSFFFYNILLITTQCFNECTWVNHDLTVLLSVDIKVVLNHCYKQYHD